jgi:protein Mpv17
LEKRQASKEKVADAMDYGRLAGTAVCGAAVYGIVGLLWYKLLDDLARRGLSLTPGTVRFVGVKLLMEFVCWHPVSLLAFWSALSVTQGADAAQVGAELRENFAPTILAEYVLWSPIDLLNFWLVPVHLQVLVLNAGCFLEAVGLSFVHANGFPTLCGA